MSHISSHFTVFISGLDSFMVYISKKVSENIFENILGMLYIEIIESILLNLI